MQINYSIRDQVYDILKKSIVQGTYAMGEQLKETQIAQELNISRSPIRSAFVKLVQNGLLEEKVNRGVFVHQATPKRVDDMIQTRLLLEREALDSAKKSGEVRTERLLTFRRNFVDSYTNDSYLDYSNTDFDLHREIISYCENDIIVEFYKRIYCVMAMYRNIALKNQNRFSSSYHEHLEIIDALLAKDFEKAWVINRQHLIDTGLEVKDALAAE